MILGIEILQAVKQRMDRADGEAVLVCVVTNLISGLHRRFLSIWILTDFFFHGHLLYAKALREAAMSSCNVPEKDRRWLDGRHCRFDSCEGTTSPGRMDNMIQIA